MLLTSRIAFLVFCSASFPLFLLALVSILSSNKGAYLVAKIRKVGWLAVIFKLIILKYTPYTYTSFSFYV